MYVSAEESIEQVSLRSTRLGLQAADLYVLAENHLEHIFTAARQHQPRVLVVDSIQTVFLRRPHSPRPVRSRRCASARPGWCGLPNRHKPRFSLWGHVTKEGALAGPRVLEHMVDTVLYFEGDSNSRYRMIRSVKNRYGAVNELGVFAMTDKGLREVSNPSAIFLTAHGEPAPGTSILVTREGSRPLLVGSPGPWWTRPTAARPRRVTGGSLNKTACPCCLPCCTGMPGIVTWDQDVFVNVVGGVKLTETAADLAILAANPVEPAQPPPWPKTWSCSER